MNIKKVTILGAATLITSCFMITACGSPAGESTENKADTVSSKEASDSKSDNNAEAIDKSIVGQWVSRDYDGMFIYTFNDDGTGNYDAAGTQMPFTFTMDEEKLSILYEGNSLPYNTVYKIDGNILTTKDSLDKDVIYDRK